MRNEPPKGRSNRSLSCPPGLFPATAFPPKRFLLNKDLPRRSASDNAYFSTLPIKAIQSEITKNNIPASISNTAGTFVCNHVFYGVRYLIEKKYKDKKSGFIHIPYLPEQVIGKADIPSMSLDNILKGITIAIETIFSVENDIKKSGGSIC